MCGIFGFADWRRPLPAAGDLTRVTNLLRHRGPDSGGYWSGPGVFFGHRRLAIIDLAGGDQPMLTADGRYVVTFNGEIYNYPELRDELSGGGARFRTASDTEVILEGYRAWGTAVAERLEGMFAFGVWDREARTLFVARDRFGEKPLLYAASPGRLVFASELAPLAAIGAGDAAIDFEALAGYLCLNYVPGTRTLRAGVRRFAPATWTLFGESGEMASGQYWRPASPDAGPSPATPSDRGALLDALQERVDHAVRMTLRSDVPVGVFLSGGVDSALVAESAARQGHLEAAFCVDVASERLSEWRRARHVVERLGIEGVRVPLDPGALGRFVEIAGHLDDPTADSSAIPVWSVAEAAARRVKVVLSGDGGDELFGGYLTYPGARMHARLTTIVPRAVWSGLGRLADATGVGGAAVAGPLYSARRLLRLLALPTGQAHFAWNGAWTPAQAASLVGARRDADTVAGTLAGLAAAWGLDGEPSIHALQLADVGEYLPNDILAKVDRATMAHGLESRAPLLNHRVADFALSMPPVWRATSRRHTKVLLRALCARHFGEDYARAPKLGFSIPVHEWLRTGGRALMQELLAGERVARLGALEPSIVSDTVNAHLTGRRTYGTELWGLMVLVTWFEQRIASPPAIRDLPPADDVRASRGG
ncbi:MAG: asparagine synthase (glutamine-hydrolyzing) [Acidimicrobiia bacterium]|nr:asparagine synthase (glutamine-hydrolyzing) [Acidimicrobiia bacterium]